MRRDRHTRGRNPKDQVVPPTIRIHIRTAAPVLGRREPATLSTGVRPSDQLYVSVVPAKLCPARTSRARRRGGTGRPSRNADAALERGAATPAGGLGSRPWDRAPGTAPLESRRGLFGGTGNNRRATEHRACRGFCGAFTAAVGFCSTWAASSFARRTGRRPKMPCRGTSSPFCHGNGRPHARAREDCCTAVKAGPHCCLIRTGIAAPAGKRPHCSA